MHEKEEYFTGVFKWKRESDLMVFSLRVVNTISNCLFYLFCAIFVLVLYSSEIFYLFYYVPL